MATAPRRHLPAQMPGLAAEDKKGGGISSGPVHGHRSECPLAAPAVETAGKCVLFKLWPSAAFTTVQGGVQPLPGRSERKRERERQTDVRVCVQRVERGGCRRSGRGVSRRPGNLAVCFDAN